MQNISEKAAIDEFVKADEDTYNLVDAIVGKFDRFRAINPAKILILFKTGKCSYTSKIAKIPPYLAPVLPYKMAIMLNSVEWQLMSKSRRIAVLFHECLHIGVSEKGMRLTKHDLQDFKELVNKVGQDYGNADVLLQELAKKETDA
jgi:predicted metallopeptidase